MAKFKSILTQNMDICYLCGAPATEVHHIFNAANKKKSEKYGLMMPICFNCHFEIHNIPGRMRETKEFGQMMFESHYPELDFLKIFGKNYISDVKSPAPDIYKMYDKQGGKK